MRIVQVNDIASVASELGTALERRGHEVVLLHPRLYGASLPPLLKLAVAPARFVDWVRLAARIRRGRFDAVHIHYAYLGVVGMMARVPYVLHCHGDDVRDLSRRPWAPAIRMAMRNARHVYYSTPDLRAQVVAVRPDAEFLPNPVNLETFHPDALPQAAPDLLVVCALAENKGAGKILDACRILAARRPGVRISAISGGTLTAGFDALPDVTLHFRQPRDRLPGLMRRHRVLAGQVHLGAIGMAELEGMACGRPLVASFTFDEAYPEPPPIIRVKTADELADAVGRLLDDPALAEVVGRASRGWVERHHDARLAAERVEALHVGPN